MKYILVVAFVLFSYMNHVHSSPIEKDLGDPITLEAYHTYWEHFEENQKSVLNQAQKRYQNSWNETEKRMEKEDKKLGKKVLERMKEAANDYREQLKSNPNADIRPHTLLNLSQILYLLAKDSTVVSSGNSEQYLDEALGFLDEIEKSYRFFEKWDYAIYLTASINERMNRSKDALSAWKVLASRDIHSKFHAYAHTAIGDHYFEQERSHKALSEYEKSLAISLKINSPDNDKKIALLQYRLIWAAYRSGNLEKVVETGQKVLKNSWKSGQRSQSEQLTNDAIKLVGDALYELSHTQNIRPFFNHQYFGESTPRLSLELASKSKSKAYAKLMVDILSPVVENFALSPRFPELLSRLGSLNQQQGQDSTWIKNLETLALLLPKASLWRESNKGHPANILKMETLSFAAANELAEWYFNLAKSSKNAHAYIHAASYFELLVDHSPQHKHANLWRINRAYSYYLAGHVEEAASQFTTIIHQQKMSQQDLKRAFELLILSRERVWRHSLAKSIQIEEVNTDTELQSDLAQLELSIENFYRKFPDDPASLDYLHLAASANKDQGIFDKAINFWNKILVAGGTVEQRKAALRGVVFASIKEENSRHLIGILNDFLRLENWRRLGPAIQKEFLGLLSQAAFDESKRLADDGHSNEAGKTLFSVAEEFTTITHRERLLRDAGYYFAIAGEWRLAQVSAEFHLQSRSKKLRGDMIYLLARSLEYQLRFGDAATQYWRLSQEFPGHKKVDLGLERAAKLADADSLHELAAKASETLSTREANPTLKSELLYRASKSYLQANHFRKSIETAKKRHKNAKSIYERLKTQVELAKIYLAAGEAKLSIVQLKRVQVVSGRSKNSLGAKRWAEILGTASITLGDYYSSGLTGEKLSLKNIPSKTKLFLKMKSAYSKAFVLENTDLIIEARYKLADHAKRFSIDLAKILHKTKNQSGPSSSLAKEVQSLRALSNDLFGKNSLEIEKNPSLTFSNTWAHRSRLRLSQSKAKWELGETYRNASLPQKVNYDLPFQWSL